METTLDYEVLVVDSSEGRLDYIAKEFPTVRWVAFKSLLHKRISIPEQRNTGIMAANGEIIVFTDASCVPDVGWLNNLVSPIINENESIVAGATFSRGKATTHDQAYKTNTHKQYINECATINLAFLRKLYDEIGGFDEKFDYGSDVDFSWRVINAGFKIRYQPTAKITHDWGDKKQELRRSFYYGRARARLHLKHNKLRYLITTDVVTIVYPIYILGLPVTIWWYPYPLLICIPLLKNYNKKPFSTVIDHIVFGVGAIYEFLFSAHRRLV
jgi:GT2 family glycosyltransferase